MYILKESVAAASDDTSELIKKAIADATRQNQAYDVIHRSIGKHREKLSSLDTNGLSVVITLSSLYYNSAAVRLQGFIFRTFVLFSLTIVHTICYSYMSQAYHFHRLWAMAACGLLFVIFENR